MLENTEDFNDIGGSQFTQTFHFILLKLFDFLDCHFLTCKDMSALPNLRITAFSNQISIYHKTILLKIDTWLYLRYYHFRRFPFIILDVVLEDWHWNERLSEPCYVG